MKKKKIIQSIAINQLDFIYFSELLYSPTQLCWFGTLCLLVLRKSCQPLSREKALYLAHKMLFFGLCKFSKHFYSLILHVM